MKYESYKDKDGKIVFVPRRTDGLMPGMVSDLVVASKEIVYRMFGFVASCWVLVIEDNRRLTLTTAEVLFSNGGDGPALNPDSGENDG